MRKNLFFNHIFGLSLEAYFEFYIVGTLNMQSLQLNLNGEILGALLAIFCLFLIHVVLTCMSLYVLTRTKKNLDDENFKYFFGEMYENTKYDTKLTLLYTTIFILRRFIYLTLGIFITDSGLAGV